ncbi:MAG: acyl-CoA dehydrogenase family protein [Natrialbaceae archaeon]|nr:acyl-CoA dehydrogenase family protein [Natrialbaceae archaeon]
MSLLHNCPRSTAGLGLAFDDLLPVFEQAGRSVLAQAAMHVSAPDEGNMHILEAAGSPAQKERWLEPLAAGDISSGFSMTEPMSGAGSDPKMVKTTAEKDGDEWVINGHKWWTTGGSEADILIVVARHRTTRPILTSAPRCFSFPPTRRAWKSSRDVPHMGSSGMSHAEITYDDVRIPEENLLGAENAGFAIAQQRLGPARLTHCMRFSGMANRALDIATAYMADREAFGDPLIEKQALRFDVAEAEIRLHAVRTMVRHAARRIAAGEQAESRGRDDESVRGERRPGRDRRLCTDRGGNGIGKDLPIADFYEAVRVFRIVDGADEVHKRSIARRALDEESLVPEELEYVTRFEE